MNAFDRHRKSLTAWCEDCNEVFDILWIANMHRDKKRHRIKVTEFWITGRRQNKKPKFKIWLKMKYQLAMA